jgi:hypothetical protein
MDTVNRGDLHGFLKSHSNFSLFTWSALSTVWTILAYSMIPHYSYWLGWLAANAVWIYMWWIMRKRLRSLFPDWQQLETIPPLEDEVMDVELGRHILPR